MTATCRRCEAEMGDGAVICGPCTSKVRTALGDLARMMPMLRTNAAGQGKTSGPIGKISGTGHSNGVQLSALDVADEVRAVITPWVRMLCEDGVISTDEVPERLDNGPADTAALCRHLASRLTLIRMTETGAEFAADVLEGGQSLVMGHNDNGESYELKDASGVPVAGSFDPQRHVFRLAQRPALVQLVEQVVYGREAKPSFREAAGENIDAAMRTFVSVKLATQAVQEAGIKVSLAKVYVVLGARDDYASRKSMEGDLQIMPDTLIELLKEHDERVSEEKKARKPRREKTAAA